MWLKNGRKYSILPKIKDIGQYKLSWQSWWQVLQPEWRKLQGSATLVDASLEGEQWEALRRGGPNGVFMVVLALAWWAAALGDMSDDEELRDAIDDVAWVMKHMAGSLGAGCKHQGLKRARGGSVDVTLAKR